MTQSRQGIHRRIRSRGPGKAKVLHISLERTRSQRESCSVDTFVRADDLMSEWAQSGATMVDVRIVWENGMRFEYSCEASDARGVSGNLALYLDMFHTRGTGVDWSDTEVRRLTQRCGWGGNSVIMASIAHSCETQDPKHASA